MPNGIATNANFTVTMGSLAPSLNFTINLASSGSELVSTAVDIPTGSWTQVNLSVLDDTWLIIAKNDGSGSIELATTGSSTARLGYMPPGGGHFNMWSGSTQLWARAYNSGSTLSIIVPESGYTGNF